MPRNSLRLVLAFAFLGVAAFASATILFPKGEARGELKANHLPMAIAGWFGQVLPIEQYVKDILETDDVVQRYYSSADHPEAPVLMAIVYSPDNRRVAHPPEVCYTGAGWEMTSKRII